MQNESAGLAKLVSVFQLNDAQLAAAKPAGPKHGRGKSPSRNELPGARVIAQKPPARANAPVKHIASAKPDGDDWEQF